MRGVRNRYPEPGHASGAVGRSASALFRVRGALGIVLLCVTTSGALAHPISVSTAYLTVRKDGISVKLEIMPEDFYMFYELKPSDKGYLGRADITESIEKHKAFLLKYIIIQDVGGAPLAGRVARVEPFEMGPEGVKMGDLMATDVVYHLAFDLASPPEFLTVYQEFGGEEAMVPAVMQLSVRRERGEWRKAVQLGRGRPHTISFDWDRPPLSLTASIEDVDKRNAQKRTKALGVTSYGSIYSFIYVTEYEVRHEILIPLLTLETWLPVKRRNRNFLEVAEQEAAREPTEAFFAERNPVEIDRIRVRPTLGRLDFYGLDFRDFARRAAPRRVSAHTARVGVILSYSTKGAPGHVKITWDMFNPAVYEVRSAVYAYEMNLKNIFSTYEPIFEWTSPGRPPMPAITQIEPPPVPRLALPVVSLACLALAAGALVVLKRRGSSWRRCVAVAGALVLCAALGWPFVRADVPNPFAPRFAMSEDEAMGVFSSLHRNVYRAFDYRSESDIYDALAKSVAGELLTELYVQIRQGLEMQEQGGAVSRIREVKIVAGRKEPPGEGSANDPRAFAFRCTWTVSGTVEHWGHIHSRTNRHEAVFRVEPVACASGTRARAWKITRVRMLKKERIKFETRLRRFS